jgi:hypothetical protein
MEYRLKSANLTSLEVFGVKPFNWYRLSLYFLGKYISASYVSWFRI